MEEKGRWFIFTVIINVELVKLQKNISHHIIVIEPGKNHQCILKLVDENLRHNKIFIQSQSASLRDAYQYKRKK